MIEEGTRLVRTQRGHTVFELNHLTKEIVVADTFPDAARPSLTRIITKPNCDYVSALNMKNVIKQYNR